MRIYKFYDTDLTGQEDYDIAGDQYKNLLKLCFKHSSTVSVIISPNYVDNIQSWEKYQIPVTPNVQNVYYHYGQPSSENPNKIGHYEIRHYRLDGGLQDLLISHTDSIFKWTYAWGYNNPDDLAFFRPDGSVFFSSIVHEGECTLSINEGEEVRGFISDDYWTPI